MRFTHTVAAGALAIGAAIGVVAPVSAGTLPDTQSCTYGNNLATCIVSHEPTEVSARTAAIKALYGYISAQNHACKPQSTWDVRTKLDDDAVSYDGSATARCVG
ncbi:MAG: hypothetical protein JOZ47_07005 [Kutzneria sp.]|nr:hypothetical protein [Kutzneria sp.]MBV9844804.1 hypothetical protein [Kutzneria sp.]